MPTCNLCGKDKNGADSCLDYCIVIEGSAFSPIKYVKKGGCSVCSDCGESRCPECNVKQGGLHHVGCGLEVCPSCRGWWINCGCRGRKVPAAELPKDSCRVIPFIPFGGRR